MEISKITNYSDDLERGRILRCKGKYPYEDVVDFMICESYDDDRGYSLYVDSGYKAGSRFVILPKESLPKENLGYAIDKNWLIDNWTDWGYSDCDINDVWVVPKETPKYPD